MGLARWYVAETKWQQEHGAQQRLQRQGFETLLPTYLRIREVHRVPVQIEAPLFIRYLFILLDVSAPAWRKAANTRGVQRLLGRDAENPTPLPEAEAEALIDKYRAGPLNEPAEALFPILDIGTTCRIEKGPLTSYLGSVSRSNDGRVWLLLRLLGRQSEIPLPREWLTVV